MSYHASNDTIWPSIAAYREAAAAASADLEAVQDHGPLEDGVIPLVAVVRNERALIEAFLAHYRSLGVRRFMIVDNDSGDGTLEVLSSMPDVDLWRTTKSFAAANQGRMWIDGLLHARAAGRWILHADADEFLVFAGMQGSTLGNLVSWLERRRLNRLFAPILDVYSDRPVRQTAIKPGDDPLAICNWFDSDREAIHHESYGELVTGGVRRRLFFPGAPKTDLLLSKFPLLRYDADTTFLSCHLPTGGKRRHTIFGRLLHVKLHAGFAARAVRAVAEKQYWRAAAEYRRYADYSTANPDFSAHYSGSKRYRDPSTLIEAGFMHDPRPRRGGLMGYLRRYLTAAPPPR